MRCYCRAGSARFRHSYQPGNNTAWLLLPRWVRQISSFVPAISFVRAVDRPIEIRVRLEDDTNPRSSGQLSLLGIFPIRGKRFARLSYVDAQCTAQAKYWPRDDCLSP